MTKKYEYHGMDITLDVLEKIRAVVELISQKENRSFDEAYIDFVNSNAYESLINPITVMWSESAEYIVDEYLRFRSIQERL